MSVPLSIEHISDEYKFAPLKAAGFEESEFIYYAVEINNVTNNATDILCCRIGNDTFQLVQSSFSDWKILSQREKF